MTEKTTFVEHRDAYLTPIVPFWIDGIVDGLRPESLCSNGDNCVRIRFSFAQHADVFLHQIFCLYNMYAKDTLNIKK